MNVETIRNYCLAKPGVTEGLPFGPDVVVFKANNKIFLLLPLDTDDLRFNVKCNPELATELRASFSAVRPGYHMNKQHWNTVLIDGSIPVATLLSFIYHSYELVAGNANKKRSR